eukprot:1770393-Karenia_brevis.AAC.1
MEEWGRSLDDDPGAYEKSMQEIEGVCKDEVDELQENLVETVNRCLKDLKKKGKSSVARMKDTMRDFRQSERS